MKCDELTIYDGQWCDKSEVYEAIAELKAENESLKAKLDTVNELVKTSKDLYDHAIESLKAGHYAEMVDAGMRERRLRRASWIARAYRAIEKIAWFRLWNANISTMDPEDGDRQEYDKWKKNLGKFLKKAEEYR